MGARQFRLLYREFLFRVIDRELLSSHAGGDSSTLLLQLVSLLIFVSLLFCLPAWSFGTVQPPQVRQLYAWSLEHFFIATTMLVVGLLAVLIWDSLFPDRRDALVLAPLPIRTRTIFLAKLAAIASALGVAVASLHLAAGLIWPVTLAATSQEFRMPAFTSDPARPAVGLDEMQAAALDRDLATIRQGRGSLAPRHDGGLVIGVSIRGERRLFAYGAATPASTFEIGSITKTFTGTLLARLGGQTAVAIEETILPATRGLAGALRVFAAYWITMLASGAFVFCAVMGLQGLALQILPRRLFLRVSSFLQLATFALIVGTYCLQAFAISPRSLLTAQAAGHFSSLPTYWFLALFQALSGSPAMASLVGDAWLGLTIATVLAATMYALAYVRTMRRIVEEADIVPSAAGMRWLPPFGGSLPTAIVQFSLRTLLRSPQHRVIVAFYWGIGFALAIFFLKTPRGGQLASDAASASAGGLWWDPGVPLLVSLLMLGLAVLGARVASALPRDLQANWIFRLTPLQGGARSLAARRRALLTLSVVPVWIASAVLFLATWPWDAAAGHLIVLALVGMTLVELSLLHGIQKIPFTCAYLPGRSNVHAMFWMVLVVLVAFTARAADYEQRALHDPVRYATIIVPLVAALAVARWRNAWLARSEAAQPQFEEEPSNLLVMLNVWDSASLRPR